MQLGPLLVLIALSAAHAQVVKVTNWADLMTPTALSNVQVCGEAQRIARLPQATPQQKTSYQRQLSALKNQFELFEVEGRIYPAALPMKSRKPFIAFQTTNGVIAHFCLKHVTDGTPLPAMKLYFNVLIYAFEKRRDPINVPDMTVFFLNRKGKVLLKMNPSGRSKKQYEASTCDGRTCPWQGTYVYDFYPNDSMAQTFKQVDWIKLTFSRGNGIETREYTLMDFLN